MIWFLIIAISLWLYWRSRQKKRLRQQHYLRNYQFPTALEKKLRKKYPDLTNEQITLVFRGLYDYFRICQLANGKMLAMPSQVVDDVWHEFILFTRIYQLFCQKSLGRFLHHTPSEAMTTPTQANESIKRAWRLACHLEDINPTTPKKLPYLFSLDGLLNIKNGFKYTLNCSKDSNSAYCAGDIGCSSGCSGDSGDSSGSGCTSSGCGGD